jgi:pantetheine-phosphate adenylyltransferase
MRVGIYAGSFAPFTKGHASIIRGAVKVFDQVLIGIGKNSDKTNQDTPNRRAEIVEAALREDMFFTPEATPRVEIFEGLLVKFCREVLDRPVMPGKLDTLPDSVSIVRGLRALNDLENEMAIADANRRLDPSFQTVFIPAEADLAYVSSSIVRELLRHDVREPLRQYLFPSTLRMLGYVHS